MELRGFEVSKQYLELQYKIGKLTREKLSSSIKKLRENYKNGTARKEMENAGHKDYMNY